jgi:hypothetical protein
MMRRSGTGILTSLVGPGSVPPWRCVPYSERERSADHCFGVWVEVESGMLQVGMKSLVPGTLRSAYLSFSSFVNADTGLT